MGTWEWIGVNGLGVGVDLDWDLNLDGEAKESYRQGRSVASSILFRMPDLSHVSCDLHARVGLGLEVLLLVFSMLTLISTPGR